MIADPLAARFDGQVVVVTGVGRAGQVGDAVAREFARRGATVVIVGRDAAKAEECAVVLRTEGLSANAYGCDLADAAAAAGLAHRIAVAHGGLVHALANVAGGFAPSGPVAESDPANFSHQLNVNLLSAYSATRAFLPFVRAARGAIAFVASAVVLPGGRVANLAGYAAAKAGLVAFMRVVAQEERSSGVRANALAPTVIGTATNRDAMAESTRFVERESVAMMIAFLCSSAAASVTGQVIELC